MSPSDMSERSVNMTERNNADTPMTDMLDNDDGMHRPHRLPPRDGMLSDVDDSIYDVYRDMRLPRLDLHDVDDPIYDMYRSLTALTIRPLRRPGSVLFEYDGNDPVILEILYGNSRSSSRSSRR